MKTHIHSQIIACGAMAAASAIRRVITVDVVSDTICPWCFIGKRRLETAIASFSRREASVDIEVRWRPFQLDPTLPAPGVDKMERYARKFGAARMAQMLPYMQATGRAEGIEFDYGGLIGNTIDSHCVLELALAEGGAALQDRVCEALMRFYFERRGDLSDKAALAEVAGGAGLTAERVAALLADDARRAAVLREAEAWRVKHAINGVPFFVVAGAGGGKLELSGAQEPDAFLDAFETLTARM